MTTASWADREPSAWPLAGYWLGMLFAGVPALLASGIVYSSAIPPRAENAPADGIPAIAMAALPLITAFAYYRSSRRYGYAASPVLAVVVVLLVWAGAAVGGVLNSFEDLSPAHLDPEQTATVRRLSEAVIWGSAGLLTVNIACAPALDVAGATGRAARIVFLVSASLWGMLILAPVLIGALGGR